MSAAVIIRRLAYLSLRRFGRDRGILGRAVTVNGRAVTVVGVMPPGFRFPSAHDLWLPYATEREAFRERRALLAIGLLQEGATEVGAQAELDAIAGRLAAQPAMSELPRAAIERAAARLATTAAAFADLYQSERRELARLAAEAPGVAITEVPLLDHDVDNVGELRVVGGHLERTGG